MKKSIFTKAALLFIVAVTTLSVNAQVQTSSFKISMQGVLKNFDGSIVDDGDYSVEFRLYDAVSAGNELWMEPVTIQTNGGLYNTYLGSTALGLSQLQNLLFDMPYYLGITIVGSNEMSPRMELTGNPYAIRANRANTANGLDLGGATITSSGGDLLLGAATTADEVVIATGNLNTGTNDIFTDQITASQGLFGEGVYVKNNYTNEKLLLGAISANDSFVYSDGAGDLNFAAKSGKVYSTSVLHLTNNSNVLAHTGYRLDQNGASPETGYTAATGLVCNNSIKAQGFHATSDRRIKKDFKLSSAKNDLSLVNSIKVTDYKFIDKASHGSKEIKGVIAQEVKEVLPNAINQSEGFVPSIYKNAIAVVFIGENIEITMAEAHNLKAGELVRVITKEEQLDKTVVSVTENTFVIEAIKDCPENLFVYGKEVDDFHSIDFNQLTSLAISAIQELSKKVEALETENAELKASNETLKAENTASINDILKRLQTIESADLKVEVQK